MSSTSPKTSAVASGLRRSAHPAAVRSCVVPQAMDFLANRTRERSSHHRLSNESAKNEALPPCEGGAGGGQRAIGNSDCEKLHMYRVLSVCGFRPLHHDVLQKEILDPGSQKGLNCLPGPIDDRLSLDVKARIQNHFAAG